MCRLVIIESGQTQQFEEQACKNGEWMYEEESINVLTGYVRLRSILLSIIFKIFVVTVFLSEFSHCVNISELTAPQPPEFC